MGALTTGNSKRGGDYFTLNCKTPLSIPSDFAHLSKKPKLFPSLNQTQQHHRISTRISRYPPVLTPIKREIHAPCRQSRTQNMGNVLGQKYEIAKRNANETLRYVKKDKEVINIDDDDEEEEKICEKGSSEDSSSIEELEENGVVAETGLFDGSGQKCYGVVAKTGLSDGSGQKLNGVVEILDNPVDGVKDSSLVTNDVLNAEKMLDSLSLSTDVGDSSYVPSYKKLLVSAEKRNDSLKRLQFQIQYTEKLRETYQLLKPQKKQEHVKEDVITEPFMPLAEEEVAEVYHALSISNRRKVLVTHENSNIDITGEILQCLRPGAWLNDEVINVYLELLKEREKREPKKYLKCHFFNTFFYKKLISGRGGYNYQSVRRWTSQRKLGYCIFECDKIFVPIHKKVHWCLAVINKKDEKLQYLDSFGGGDAQVLKVLARYFTDEVKDKNGKDIDVSSWKQEFVEDLPKQDNDFDCGVFMIKYADFYSRDIGLCFNQAHMPYFRLRTAKEILRLKAD